ncbi:unnamed protein product [Brassicogethes aeneus]|uniref:Uncharacterized protein n=1 Tax=Brassicogethes aeneus TaxID=1431903 RepID=A0A9P0BEQ7_BRAAE|nr:unnamed protein product [Brassicogethes aeneus]
MDIHEDVCHFCCQKSKVITNGILFTKIIKTVLSDEVLNSSEFSRLKARLNTCLLCAQKLLIIDKTRKKIENATVNKHFNCILCNEDDHLVQIHNWNYLNQLLEELDCVSKIKKFKVCLECYYFIDTCSQFKKSLFSSFPGLQVNKIKLAINYQTDINKTKVMPSLSPKTRRKLNSLCLSKNKLYRDNKLVTGDEQLYNKIAYILVEQQNLEKLKLQCSKDAEKITLRMSRRTKADTLDNESEKSMNKKTSTSSFKKENSSKHTDNASKSSLPKINKKKLQDKKSSLDLVSEEQPTRSTRNSKTIDESSFESSSDFITKISTKKFKKVVSEKDLDSTLSKESDLEKENTENSSEDTTINLDCDNKIKSSPTKGERKSIFDDSSDSEMEVVFDTETLSFDDLFNLEENKNYQKTDVPTKCAKTKAFDSSDSENEDKLRNTDTNSENVATSKEINIEDSLKKHNILKVLCINIERKSLDVEKKKKRKSVTFKEDNMVEYFPIIDDYSSTQSDFGLDAGHTPKPNRRLSSKDSDEESEDLEEIDKESEETITNGKLEDKQNKDSSLENKEIMETTDFSEDAIIDLDNSPPRENNENSMDIEKEEINTNCKSEDKKFENKGRGSSKIEENTTYNLEDTTKNMVNTVNLENNLIDVEKGTCITDSNELISKEKNTCVEDQEDHNTESSTSESDSLNTETDSTAEKEEENCSYKSEENTLKSSTSDNSDSSNEETYSTTNKEEVNCSDKEEGKSEETFSEQSESIVTSSEETVNKKRQRSSNEANSDTESNEQLKKNKKTLNLNSDRKRKHQFAQDNEDSDDDALSSNIKSPDIKAIKLNKKACLSVDTDEEREKINSIAKKYTGSLIFTPVKEKGASEKMSPLMSLQHEDISNDDDDILSGFQCIDEESAEEEVETTEKDSERTRLQEKSEDLLASLNKEKTDVDTMEDLRKAIENDVKSKNKFDEIILASEPQNVLDMLTSESDEL